MITNSTHIHLEQDKEKVIATFGDLHDSEGEKLCMTLGVNYGSNNLTIFINNPEQIRGIWEALNPYFGKDGDEKENNLSVKLAQLEELVYMEDISHPVTPEYREHHESIQKILNFIRKELN